MGSGSSKLVKCPKCTSFRTKDGSEFMEHIYEKHSLKCSICNTSGFPNDQLLNDHVENKHHTSVSNTGEHLLTCPKCFNRDIENERELVEHLQNVHAFNSVTDIKVNSDDEKPSLQCPECFENIQLNGLLQHMKDLHVTQNAPDITCPLCNDYNQFLDGDEFLAHLKEAHNYADSLPGTVSSVPVTDGSRKLPRVGDKVLAMWSRSLWQYFHATIVQFHVSELRYEINWDDGDTTGRVVDYHNIALDKVPDMNEIGIGSIVLFGQGNYKAGATQLSGGLRWHQGCITNIYNSADNKYKLYDGEHTKGSDEGKFVTYKGFSQKFTGYRLDELRIGPNVFDILNAEEDKNEGVTSDDIDIYFSLDRPNNTNNNLQTNNNCDPNDVIKVLKEAGLNVMSSDVESISRDLKEKARLMKNSKVFIACINDEYVHNEQCRMEFQYAKSTLRKPVLPLVFGEGMEWTMSVVGMLIVGELYIHLKDKSVQDQKLTELLNSLQQHINLKDKNNSIDSTDIVTVDPIETPGDVFVSYCWSNSFMAKELNQIQNLNGNKYSDPRLIAGTLKKDNVFTWLDIERLKSGKQGAGLFEQLAIALKDAKVVVTCISDQYAASKNCQMELQFSYKSLGKPLIPIIVGTGNAWRDTVVGLLISTNDIEVLDFQNVTDENSYQQKMNTLKNKISKFIAGEAIVPNEKSVSMSHAPQQGDHVISHHFDFCYYMATVVEFNRATMEYTVQWDDGDTTGTVQKYNKVAIDVVPAVDDIGVGSLVFFTQGSYVINGTPGVRYHEGVVTSITRENNRLYFDGNHSYTAEDGKHCSYRNYSHNFYRIPLEELRIAPSALEAMKE